MCSFQTLRRRVIRKPHPVIYTKKIYIYMYVLKADGGAAVVFAPGGLQNVENHFP